MLRKHSPRRGVAKYKAWQAILVAAKEFAFAQADDKTRAELELLNAVKVWSALKDPQE